MLHKISTLENSGPIALSIMVILSECHHQRIEYIPVTRGLTLNIATKAFKRLLMTVIYYLKLENNHYSF